MTADTELTGTSREGGHLISSKVREPMVVPGGPREQPEVAEEEARADCSAPRQAFEQGPESWRMNSLGIRPGGVTGIAVVRARIERRR